MNKRRKNYCPPQMEVIELKQVTNLLVGSGTGGDIPGTPGYND